MGHRFIPIAVFMILLSLQHDLYADDTSLRCGNDLISLGDTMYEVRNACGEPYSSQTVGERKTYKILNKEQLRIDSIAYVTEWIYQGNNGFYVLTYEGSRLIRKEFRFK